MKTALICGVGGQDGSLLARLLVSKGYSVFGTTRDAQGGSFSNLHLLGVYDQVKLISMAPEDFRSVFAALNKSKPDEVYFLAGQSSVGLSFDQPAETIKSFTLGTLNILEACRMSNKVIRQYHAGSSECFGDTDGIASVESTSFSPRSPYAVAKSSAFWLVNNYREAYGLFACTGILFNHESPLRPKRFVTQKIIQAAKRIASGSKERLQLGRLDISRDWGWAPDYVEAMWLMLQQQTPEDFVIATGKSFTLQEFVDHAFAYFDLDWKCFVDQSPDLYRPTDIALSSANPSKAFNQLQWKARHNMPSVVSLMIKESIELE